MLSTLLHITINGPEIRSSECHEMLNEATKMWRESHTRNLEFLKHLPRVGGQDYAQFNPNILVSTGIQVNLFDEEEVFRSNQGQKEDPNTLMDKRVQVEGEGVTSSKEQLSIALFELGMDSVKIKWKT